MTDDSSDRPPLGANAEKPRQPGAQAAETDPDRIPPGAETVSTPVLFGADVSLWIDATKEQKLSYLKQVNANYTHIRESFLKQANSYAEAIPAARRWHRQWRKWLIWLTGGLAALNLIAAFLPPKPNTGFWLNISFWAAGYATMLTVLGNVESYNNYAEKADNFRASREAALDAHRTFEMLWHTHVGAFGDRPEACANATELYRRIVARDVQARAMFKDLSTLTTKQL